MTKMNNNSSNADDQLSEDDLVSLERALESGNRAAFDSDSSPKMAYLRAFEAIDQLAAPVRAAIEPFDRPPAIEDYEELTEIARGGMGIVYRGFHKKTKRYDAIKVIRPDRLVGTAKETATLLRLQFLRECQLAARVAHEHIVPVYQVGEVDDSPWYSMQLVEGTSLHELTHGTVISTERIVRYIEQIARTLDVVHRHGILHGDLKPQNILIELQKDKPLIGDFGLAGWEATFESEINAGVVGTPAYLAPELATAALHGSSPDDTKAARTVSSDVYSLGATLWAALAGCSPCFENRSISEQLVDVATGNLKFSQPCDRKLPPVITQIIQKCVSLDPMSRYTSAGEWPMHCHSG